MSSSNVSVEVYVEALELNGFQTEGCKRDIKPSLSAAEGMVGKIEQKSNILSVYDTTRSLPQNGVPFVCAHLRCLSLGMKQCIRDS